MRPQKGASLSEYHHTWKQKAHNLITLHTILAPQPSLCLAFAEPELCRWKPRLLT
jgi:hypothetical protein